MREIPRLQRRALAKSLDYYREAFDDAKIGMAAAYATGDYTMEAIADVFGVHYATVSRASAASECHIARPDTVALLSIHGRKRRGSAQLRYPWGEGAFVIGIVLDIFHLQCCSHCGQFVRGKLCGHY